METKLKTASVVPVSDSFYNQKMNKIFIISRIFCPCAKIYYLSVDNEYNWNFWHNKSEHKYSFKAESSKKLYEKIINLGIPNKQYKMTFQNYTEIINKSKFQNIEDMIEWCFNCNLILNDVKIKKL